MTVEQQKAFDEAMASNDTDRAIAILDAIEQAERLRIKHVAEAAVLMLKLMPESLLMRSERYVN